MRLLDDFATSTGIPAVTIRPPSSPAPGPDIDYPVAAGNHSHVVFNQDHGIPCFDKTIELDHQLLHVCRMESGRRFIKDIKSVAALYSLQLSRELDSLRLAPESSVADWPGGCSRARPRATRRASGRILLAHQRRISRQHPLSFPTRRRCSFHDT